MLTTTWCLAFGSAPRTQAGAGLPSGTELAASISDTTWLTRSKSSYDVNEGLFESGRVRLLSSDPNAI